MLWFVGLRSDVKEIERISNENGNYFETVLFVLGNILYTDSHSSSSKALFDNTHFNYIEIKFSNIGYPHILLSQK